MGEHRCFRRWSDIFQDHRVVWSCRTHVPKAHSSFWYHTTCEVRRRERDLQKSEGSGDKGVREALESVLLTWVSSIACLDQQFQRKYVRHEALWGWLKTTCGLGGGWWLFFLVDILGRIPNLIFVPSSVSMTVYTAAVPQWDNLDELYSCMSMCVSGFIKYF